MGYKKEFRKFGKVLLVITLVIIVVAGLVIIEIWLTNWLEFTGYALSMIFRLLGLGFSAFVMLKLSR
jgi:cytochrome bd-type quinol oxidase subunit 1